MTKLQKLNKEVEKLGQSKAIQKKGQTERTNFVRMNYKQNYKPQLRGEQFKNKFMGKKRNQLKNRDNFKRRLQIEQAKSRDQVNVYGGLGKVGLDHEGPIGEDGALTQVEVPGFSESALKYVKKVKKTDEEIDQMGIIEAM